MPGNSPAEGRSDTRKEKSCRTHAAQGFGGSQRFHPLSLPYLLSVVHLFTAAKKMAQDRPVGRLYPYAGLSFRAGHAAELADALAQPRRRGVVADVRGHLRPARLPLLPPPRAAGGRRRG